MDKRELTKKEMDFFIKLGEERAYEIECKENKERWKIEKEEELLATMINSPETSIEIFDKISFEMLSDENREIFETISSLKPLESGTITWELKKRNYNFFDKVLDLSSKIIPNVKQRITEFFDLSDAIKADKFLYKAYKKNQESIMGLDALSELKENIDAELSKYSRFQKTLSFDENLPKILERIESKFKKDFSLKTKEFPSFNTGTGGLNEGNLIGIAGAFKNGKTTFGLNLILDFAEQNIPCAIFSLEMSSSEIEEKILAYKTNLSYEKIRNPQRLTSEERTSLLRYSAQRKSSDEKLFIFDRAFTITEIESNIKKLKDKYGLKVILLDYLGLVKSVSKNRNPESREREISQLSSSLKLLAKETDTIIFVLSQLNRSGIKEASSINLAESIGLARDCDFLFTINRPNEKNEAFFEVKLDSSRHTASGNVFLLQLLENGKMREVETKFDNSYLSKLQVFDFETEPAYNLTGKG